MADTCSLCSKTVYPVEKIRAIDKSWHKLCFKCTECGLQLNLKTFKGFQGSPYCNVHLPQQKATQVADSVTTKTAAAAPKRALAQGVKKTDRMTVGVGMQESGGAGGQSFSTAPSAPARGKTPAKAAPSAPRGGGTTAAPAPRGGGKWAPAPPPGTAIDQTPNQNKFQRDGQLKKAPGAAPPTATKPSNPLLNERRAGDRTTMGVSGEKYKPAPRMHDEDANKVDSWDDEEESSAPAGKFAPKANFGMSSNAGGGGAKKFGSPAVPPPTASNDNWGDEEEAPAAAPAKKWGAAGGAPAGGPAKKWGAAAPAAEPAPPPPPMPSGGKKAPAAGGTKWGATPARPPSEQPEEDWGGEEAPAEEPAYEEPAAYEEEPAYEEAPAESYEEAPADDGGFQWATATFQYDAQEDNEISFAEGDAIKVYEFIDEGWWRGEGPDGAFGMFPSNYVELQA